MFAESMPKRRLLLTISLVEGDTIRATVITQKTFDAEENACTTLDASFGDYLSAAGVVLQPSAEVLP